LGGCDLLNSEEDHRRQQPRHDRKDPFISFQEISLLNLTVIDLNGGTKSVSIEAAISRYLRKILIAVNGLENEIGLLSNPWHVNKRNQSDSFAKYLIRCSCGDFVPGLISVTSCGTLFADSVDLTPASLLAHRSEMGLRGNEADTNSFRFAL
jgi:hypothetical protein